MISPETLKPFILHEDQFIGCAIARYFHEGWILDKDIIPLLLQARQKHSWTEYSYMLGYGDYQPIDEAAFDIVIEEIKRTSSSQEKFILGHLVRWAPLEFVDKFMKRADARTTDFLEIIDYFEHRLEAARLSDEILWQSLRDTCSKMDDHPDKPERDHIFLSSVVETLALRQIPDNAEICRLLEDKEVEDKWLELYLIDLAGARKISAAIPSLLRRLGAEDDDWMPVNCANALVRIADPDSIRTLQKTYIQRDNTYWPFALEVFERFRHPETEQIILELLDNEILDDASRDWLIYALCAQFSPHAIERYENQWKGIEEEIHGNLHREVLVAAVVNGIQLPYAREFRRETLVKEAYFASWKSPAGNNSIYDEEEEEEEEEEEAWEEAEEDEAWEAPFEPQVTSSDYGYPALEPFRRPTPKVGRNAPCPCGSGKKYKKCCGKNIVE